MVVEIKKLPNSTAEITGEISADDFEKAYQKALKKFNDNSQIPGFRPGHVPDGIITEKVGQNHLLEHAAETSLEDEYPKILEENKIEAIGRPEVTITKIARGNPLGFKIKTAVLPEIALPDYKKIAGEITAKKEEVKVEEKEIDEALEYLRQSEKKAGLPEINDEFAKKLGQKDLIGLRETLRQNITGEKEIKAREKKRMEMLDKVSASTEFEVPQVLIDSEKEKMSAELRSSIENMGMKWDEYLKHVKKTEEELKKDWDKEAARRARYALILREIADAEKIEPTEEELNDFAEKVIAQHYPELEEQKIDPVRSKKPSVSADSRANRTSYGIDKERLKDYAYGMLRNEKIFQFLETQK